MHLKCGHEPKEGSEESLGKRSPSGLDGFAHTGRSTKQQKSHPEHSGGIDQEDLDLRPDWGKGHKTPSQPVAMVHVCNPSYSRSTHRRITV
jgi:hypothetical protein